MYTVTETVQSKGQPPTEIRHRLHADLDLIQFIVGALDTNRAADEEIKTEGFEFPCPVVRRVVIEFNTDTETFDSHNH